MANIKTVVCIMVLSAIATIAAGCRLAEESPSSNECIPLTGIVLCTYSTQSPIIVEVDCEEQQLRVFGSGLNKAHKGMYLMEVTLSKEEAQEMIRLISDNGYLADFRPQLSWFRGDPGIKGNAVYEITWRSQSVCYAQPPKSIRQSAPQEAQAVYSGFDRATATLYRLVQKYVREEPGSVKNINRDDPSAKDYREKEEDMIERALPTDRDGW